MSEAVAQEQPDTVERVPLSRREFLYYLWGISMSVFMAGSTGAVIWYALPRFREGEFGGVFTIPVAEIPAPDAAPKEYPEGRFWLLNVGDDMMQDPRQPGMYHPTKGVKALYKVCTHLGCLYKWVPTNDRFECPCHGSKFLETGTRIDGPARRNLDVFPIEVVDASGEILVRTEPAMDGSEGTAVEVPPEAVSLMVDTGRTIVGAPNSQPGGGI
jgi:cytochrome b6-f complex iron-sulfur subunit